jgi:hypothetical protein
MALTMSQVSLSAGEITPSVYGRTDIQFWGNGVREALNFTVNFHGGLKNRPGCIFIGQSGGSGAVALQSFQFSTVQTYMLEFTAGKLRILSGGAYLVDESNEIIEVVTPYLEEELSSLTFTQKADVLSIFSSAHPVNQLLRFSNTDWQLIEYNHTFGPFESLNVDTANTIWASGQSGIITLESDFDVFTDEMVGTQLKLNQQSSGEVVSWVQRMSVTVGDTSYYAGGFYRAIKARTNGSGEALTGDTPPTHTSGSFWDGPNSVLDNSGYDNIIGVLWEYMHSGFGVVEITSVVGPREALCQTITNIPEGIVGGDVSAFVQTVENQTDERVFNLSPSFTSQVQGDYSVQLVQYDGNGAPSENLSNFGINFFDKTLTIYKDPVFDPTGDNLPRNVVITQSSSIKSTYAWGFSAWRESNGYPRCGSYYQQRFCTGGTKDLPQTLWMSYTDSYDNYAIDNPVIAENSMRFDVDSQQVNEILHMISMNAFLAFTSGSVWAINQGNNYPIDASDPPSIAVQSYNGACSIPPIVTGTRAIYVQDGQQIIRDIAYDYSKDAFDGDDLTVRASHLFEGRNIVDWCYAKHPSKLIWVAFDDGEFAILTYMKEQDVLGWSSGKVDGDIIALGSVREGEEDFVYAVIKRNDINHTVRFSSRSQQESRDQCFLDLALSADGRASVSLAGTTAGAWEFPNKADFISSGNYFTEDMEGKKLGVWNGNQTFRFTVDAVYSETSARVTIEQRITDETISKLESGTVTDWGRAFFEFSGLDHLEGDEVYIVADGAVQGSSVVADGSVSIDESLASLVTYIGLKYDQRIHTLPLNVEMSGNNYKSSPKQINRINVLVNNTATIKAGQYLDKLTEYKGARGSERMGQAPRKKSKLLEISNIGNPQIDGGYYIVNDLPIACEILALYPEVTIGN